MVKMLILVVLILLLVLILLYYFYDRSSEEEDSSVIHAHCSTVNRCADGLVCDGRCGTCKQKPDGPCSGNVDCIEGYICHQWKCILPIDACMVNDPKKTNNKETKKKSHKKVRWVDE